MLNYTNNLMIPFSFTFGYGMTLVDAKNNIKSIMAKRKKSWHPAEGEEDEASMNEDSSITEQSI